MPVTRKSMTEGTDQPGEFEFAGEVVHFTYNPAGITGETIRDALEVADVAADTPEAKATGMARGYLTLCEQLPTFVTSWDVLERNPRKGEALAKVPRVPITNESLLGLPVAFVYALSNAVQGAQNPPAAGSFDGG